MEEQNQVDHNHNENQEVEKRAEFVLRNKDFFLLFVGSVVSNLGTHIFNFAMSLYILKLAVEKYGQTIGVVQAGLFMAFGGVVFFVFSLFGGAIVDRLDKVKVVYTTDILNGIAIGLAGLAIFSGLETDMIIVTLYATSFVLGINGALFNPAARSLPVHILEENQMQQSSSMSQGMQALYGIIGPILGGVAYALFSIEVIFWINGVSFILSGISEFFIQAKTTDGDVGRISLKGTLKDIGIGFGYLWKLKGIRNMLLIAALLNFFTVPVIVNGFPYLFIIELDVEPIYYSIIMASFPAGIIISSLILGSQKQKERVSPMLVAGLFGMSFAFTGFAIATYALLQGWITFIVFIMISIGVTVLTGYFNGYVNVPFSVAIMKRVDKNMMGRVFSAVGLLSGGVTPIAIALGGVALGFFGITGLLLFACIAMFVTSIMTKLNGPISEI